MKGIVTVTFVVVLLIIAFTAMPDFLSGVHDAQTDAQTDTFTGASVAGGKASVTLTKDLWKNAVTSVESVASAAVSAPYASAYTASTRALEISGLTGATDNLTVVYARDANPDLTGVGGLLGLAPYILIGVLILVVMLGIAMAVTNRR